MDKSKPLTIEEIHKETLGVLKKFISICDEIKVNYFVAYGSLIGAVRHQGFIPWDDDFDVVMLRPDYDKFVEYCDEHVAELYPYKLINRGNTKDYPFGISRFNDIRFRMESDEYPDAGMGVFIDVYPFDGAGNNPTDAYDYINKRMKFYMTMCSLSVLPHWKASKKGIVRSSIKYVLYILSKIIGTKFFLDRLDAIRYKYVYENSSYVGVITWGNLLMPVSKNYFDDYVYLNFENIQVKVPKNYDDILRTFYGNYMKLPPVEKQIATHGYLLYRRE